MSLFNTVFHQTNIPKFGGVQQIDAPLIGLSAEKIYCYIRKHVLLLATTHVICDRFR